MGKDLSTVDINKIDDNQALRLARETYGNKNQIMVCIEELNELACVLAKYPRYDNEETAKAELRDKALDELADVYIVLEHAKSILGISNFSVENRAWLKLERMKRWLNSSTSMQQTIDDRVVGEESTESSCEGCIRENNKDEVLCNMCLASEAVEGIKPHYYKER